MNMNLITTIVGFSMSAAFIVFVCSRLMCRRLRRLEAQHMLEIGSLTDLHHLPEHRINGVSPLVVAAIPTMKFNREAFSSMENTQCAICLSEYQEDEVLRIMPKCEHSFHLSCIDEWLKKQSTCPVCRLSLQHSFDISISTQHSRQWLLPPTTRDANSDSTAIQLDATSTSS